MNPSASEAREMLARANTLSRNAARFPLSWIGYIMLCAAGPLYLIASYFNGGGPPPPIVWAVIGAWAFFGTMSSAIFGALSGPAPKGFGARWGVMIGLWGIMWGFSLLGPSITSGQLVLQSYVYLGLALAGPVWDLSSLRGQRMK
ncbi:hypothetical protein KBX17_10405 [Corynebacterium sp. CCUG 65737]|uniref:hypothetical protein n=1 Tax=Corynebacterium sp. CCUG 65737 TaxID=2823889 RepID=UPI00210CE942|nr:hypothetical protein [Corynebacterium sp. CCUG 65737]MCQ4628205.1 hypothetical protein [Corynebacterium sp. CCUG 65737]